VKIFDDDLSHVPLMSPGFYYVFSGSNGKQIDLSHERPPRKPPNTVPVSSVLLTVGGVVSSFQLYLKLSDFVQLKEAVAG